MGPVPEERRRSSKESTPACFGEAMVDMYNRPGKPYVRGGPERRTTTYKNSEKFANRELEGRGFGPRRCSSPPTARTRTSPETERRPASGLADFYSRIPTERPTPQAGASARVPRKIPSTPAGWRFLAARPAFRATAPGWGSPSKAPTNHRIPGEDVLGLNGLKRKPGPCPQRMKKMLTTGDFPACPP